MRNVESGTADKIRLECPKQLSGRKKNWSTVKIKLFQVSWCWGWYWVIPWKGEESCEWNYSEVVPDLCPVQGGDVG